MFASKIKILQLSAEILRLLAAGAMGKGDENSQPILKIKRFRGFKVDLTLNLGTDESRIQHAMIVVGTNVGSS
jgi:hypothetical protein